MRSIITFIPAESKNCFPNCGLFEIRILIEYNIFLRNWREEGEVVLVNEIKSDRTEEAVEKSWREIVFLYMVAIVTMRSLKRGVSPLFLMMFNKSTNTFSPPNFKKFSTLSTSYDK